MFLGYMVVDTQEIIEKAHYGDLDYIKHALTLFTDFAAVFVRLLIIMVSSFILLKTIKVHRLYISILHLQFYITLEDGC